MTDWLGGYSAAWEVRRVNQDTWQDGAALSGVRSVSVEKSCDGDAPTIESGSMTIDGDSTFDAGWYRVSMIATQGGGERVPVATLLFERASSRTEKSTVELECTGRSTLQPAADVKMPTGSYAPAGVDGAALAARLVSACTPAPVTVDGSFKLVDDYVFDPGCSNLEAAWRILNAAGWCMQIAGDGSVVVHAKPTEPALELSRANAGLLIPGVDDDFNIVNVPNRYYAVSGEQTAVATNEDADSLASYPVRGRWVDVVDTAPAPVDGESLEMYAARKLAEMSTVLRNFTYYREWWPDVVPNSVVRASLANEGVEGDLRVISQSIECGRGAKVSETAGMEVRV